MPDPLRKKWSRRLNRKITVIIVPHSQWKPWRVECTAAFLAFCLLAWSGLTMWAAFVCGRNTDYWITKADNKVMNVELSRLSDQMNRSWRILSEASATDARMRALLGMHAQNDEGVGGPTAADELRIQRMLLGQSPMNQAAWHKQIATIREESVKRLASFQEIAWAISNRKNLYEATPDMWPTEGQITSLFGYRVSPMRQTNDVGLTEFHPGVDIASRPNTPIYATADGTVRYAGWTHGYGEMVIIDHGYGISTVYGHNTKLLVQTGEHVWRGQIISFMGTTGRSTGPHLHYEIRINGVPVNPMKFLKVRPEDAAQPPLEAVNQGSGPDADAAN